MAVDWDRDHGIRWFHGIVTGAFLAKVFETCGRVPQKGEDAVGRSGSTRAKGFLSSWASPQAEAELFGYTPIRRLPW
jgi:hypothetical protein